MTLKEFQSYVDVDSSLECHGELTPEEICTSVRQCELQQQSDGEGDEGATVPAPIPKSGEVMQAMHTVRAFLELNGSELSMFYSIESQVLKIISDTTTQTSIRDYFSLPSPEY